MDTPTNESKDNLNDALIQVLEDIEALEQDTGKMKTGVTKPKYRDVVDVFNSIFAKLQRAIEREEDGPSKEKHRLSFYETYMKVIMLGGGWSIEGEGIGTWSGNLRYIKFWVERFPKE